MESVTQKRHEPIRTGLQVGRRTDQVHRQRPVRRVPERHDQGQHGRVRGRQIGREPGRIVSAASPGGLQQ